MTTKESVFAILKCSDDYVSGEKISLALGISRAAVNTAVKALRTDGYDIQSKTNKGYLLNNSPDKLTAGELLAYIPADRMENILYVDTVDSTNKRLRDMAYDGVPEGQVVIANEQTQGRGRLGRTFVSPKDKGIYLSILLRPEGAPSDSVSLTAWAAVAVCNAIERVCGVRPGIKWVNDLVLNRRKICGILTEMLVESESGRIQYVIVGIGVNVSEGITDFPEEIRKIASSIYAETGVHYSRAQLAASIINELDVLRTAWPREKEAYLKAYRNDSVIIGNELRIVSGNLEYCAAAVAINDDFSLSIKHPDGHVEKLSSGEVSVRGFYE